MIIQEIFQKSIWDRFFEEAGSPSFLQSWQWGEFQKNLGCDILRLGLYDKEELVAIALVEKINAKRGRFLFVPHGPLVKIKDQRLKIKTYLKNLKTYLLDSAVKENYSFIRIAPVFEDKPEYQRIFHDLGFKTAPIYIHSERCWILNLNKTEEELLTDMRKTTRYSIRKAERDGVIIEKRTDDKAVNDFLSIYAETAKREQFVPFSKKYIENEFEAFHKTGSAVFLFGYLTLGVGSNPSNDLTPRVDEIVAGALVLFTKSTAFYHQGASIHTKIPVTYLLQWEAIKEAKKRGCQFYNFWGILQEGRTPKNWAGLSLFKTGFGGFQLDYLQTQDYIISPKYYLTYLYEKFLAWKRGV